MSNNYVWEFKEKGLLLELNTSETKINDFLTIFFNSKENNYVNDFANATTSNVSADKELLTFFVKSLIEVFSWSLETTTSFLQTTKIKADFEIDGSFVEWESTQNNPTLMSKDIFEHFITKKNPKEKMCFLKKISKSSIGTIGGLMNVLLQSYNDHGILKSDKTSKIQTILKKTSLSR